MTSYYEDEQFSDFTITCEGRVFKVHRCFIAPHSRFFEKACSGMFKETQERKIDLKEDDPNMVELMIKFFYTFDYDTPDQSGTSTHDIPNDTEISPLGLHARLYTLADKYEVLALKSIALARFKKGLVESYTDEDAMVAATRDLGGFLPPPTCDTTLHDLMIEAWIRGGEDLYYEVGEENVSSLFKEMSWLSAGLATRMLERSKTGTICGHCNELISQDDCLKKREAIILHLRWNLQSGLLHQNQSLKEEDMSYMDELLGKLEGHGDIEPSIISNTKILETLKVITKIFPIPKDEELGFKRRVAKLVEMYSKRILDGGGATQRTRITAAQNRRQD
jgi:hypothetical protein